MIDSLGINEITGIYVDGFMLLVAVIMLIAVLREAGRNEARNKILSLVILLECFSCIFEMATYITKGDFSTMWIYSALMSLVYAINIFCIFLISLYEVVVLREKAFIYDAVLYVIGFVCGLCALLWMMDCFGAELFTYYNEFCELVDTDFRFIVTLVPGLVLMFDLCLAASFRETMSTQDFIIWLIAFLVLPVYEGVQGLLNIDYIMPGMIFTSMVFYVGIHTKRNTELLQAETELARKR